MGIVDNIKKHFDERSHDPIEVPEWNVTIYHNPITVEERRRVLARGKDGLSPDSGLIHVRSLIRLARDKDGNRLFDDTDEKHLLHHADPDVCARVSNILMGWVASPNTDPNDVLDEAGND